MVGFGGLQDSQLLTSNPPALSLSKGLLLVLPSSYIARTRTALRQAQGGRGVGAKRGPNGAVLQSAPLKRKWGRHCCQPHTRLPSVRSSWATAFPGGCFGADRPWQRLAAPGPASSGNCCLPLPFCHSRARRCQSTGVPRPASLCRRGGPVRRWFRPESLSLRLAVPRLLPALPARTFIPLRRSAAFLSSVWAALKRSTDFAPLTASAVRWAAPKSVPSAFSDTAAGIAAGILRFLFSLLIQ